MTAVSLAEMISVLDQCRVPTPLVQLNHDCVELFAKLEYSNVHGSTKDRSAFWILKCAIERGDINEDTLVVESSSGNFATAMAGYCRSLGLRFVPVLDASCLPAIETYLRLSCNRVEKVPPAASGTGNLTARLARVAAVRAEPGQIYWPDQYSNPDALSAHYLLLGGELLDAFSKLDYVFIGAGTGATLGGLSRRLKEVFPAITVIAVDIEGSSIFGGPPAPRHIPGLGSTLSFPPLVREAVIDQVLIVSERDTVIGCHRLLREHGVYAGGSSGTVYSAICHYFEGYSGPRPRVAFLCADRGTAYADTIYNVDWVSRTIGNATAVASAPLRAQR